MVHEICGNEKITVINDYYMTYLQLYCRLLGAMLQKGLVHNSG